VSTTTVTLRSSLSPPRAGSPATMSLQTRCPGEEDRLSAQILPQFFGVTEDMVHILWRETRHGSEIDTEVSLDLVATKSSISSVRPG